MPEVTELTWHLSCFTPYPMLANAHSFKDKADRLSDVNGGLFVYPVLMAADILMYDANYVPVGKDQKQHLEMTRDIASAFNHQFGETKFINYINKLKANFTSLLEIEEETEELENLEGVDPEEI